MKERTPKQEYRNYLRLYRVTRVLFGIVYWFRFRRPYGIPNGPAIVCANHSSWIDPFIIAFAFGQKQHLHFMAKVELFGNKLIGGVISAIGSFRVRRGESDVASIKNVVRYLRAGDKVGIFPEGTRVSEDDSVSAKTGAVRMANRMNVPLVPVFIPRKKRFFRTMEIIVGEPFYVTGEKGKLTPEEYRDAADDLMKRISALGRESTQ